MMLAMPARLCEADASMKRGQWLKKELERTELHGKTLGLVGIGRIAREIAIRAKAFGMKVIAFDKFVPSSDVAEMTSLERVLSESHVVSLHVPLTDETKGMINKASIAKMRKGAFLVNTCRGQVIVEEDVVAALNSGQLGGYAADVFYKEPPEGSPLLSAPRVVLAPHLGASTEENLLRLGDSIVDRLTKYSKK
jgi:D-3-phosphoglycerate dehydrogenase